MAGLFVPHRFAGLAQTFDYDKSGVQCGPYYSISEYDILSSATSQHTCENEAYAGQPGHWFDIKLLPYEYKNHIVATIPS